MQSFDWESEWGLGAAIDLEDLPIRIDGTAVNGPELRPYVALGTCEVSRLDVDASEAWEDREVLIRGRISEPEIGALGEGIAFSVRRITGLSTVLDPPDSAVIGDGYSTYNTGAVMPSVFGEPGLTTGGGTPGSIALHIESDPSFPVYAVAAHPVAASTVEVAALISDGSDTRTWYTSSVTSGSPSTITSSNTGGGAKIGVRWTGGGGMLRHQSVLDSSGNVNLVAVRTAGQLIERMLRLTGDCDRGRTAAAVPLLPQRVDGYYDVQVDPIEWLTDNVLSVFPVSLVRGPGGWYPVVWRGWLDTVEPVLSLDVADGDLVRVGALTADGSDEAINEVRIRYAPDVDLREYRRQLTVTGAAVINPGPTRAHSRRGGFSVATNGGHIVSRTIETDIVYRTETAHQIAAWMMVRYALPSWIGGYDLHPRHRRKVSPGDVVLLTDEEMGLDAQPVSIEQIVDSAGETRIGIRTIEDVPDDL